MSLNNMKAIDLNWSKSVAIPAQVMARQIGDETVILDLASGTYYGLDFVGARIWQLLAQGLVLFQVRDQVLAEYDVPIGELELDLNRLLRDLSDKNLINLGE